MSDASNQFSKPMHDPPLQNFESSGDYSNPLLAPAIVLLIFSILYLLLQLIGLPNQLATLNEIDTSTPEGAGEYAGQIFAVFFMAISAVIVLIGSIYMIRLKSYRSAMTAAIVSSIPCCSPCLFLGIPFGIWAIVVLARPDVKSRFQ